jgi:tetratricopeptide (TPR) repeat protein
MPNSNGKGKGISAKPNRAQRRAALSKQYAAKQEEVAALISSGNARFDAADHDGAIADYERAIEIDREIALADRNRRNIAAAYANRGNARANDGDYDGAREDYERVNALEPSIRPSDNRAQTYEEDNVSRGIVKPTHERRL